MATGIGVGDGVGVVLRVVVFDDIALFGSNAGKTSLGHRIQSNHFPDTYIWSVVENFSFVLAPNHTHLRLWDTNSLTRLSNSRHGIPPDCVDIVSTAHNFPHIDVFCVCFSLAKPKTTIPPLRETYLPLIREALSESARSFGSRCILVGCQSDLDTEDHWAHVRSRSDETDDTDPISRDEIEQLRKECPGQPVRYVECSARLDEGVGNLLNVILEVIREKNGEVEQRRRPRRNCGSIIQMCLGIGPRYHDHSRRHGGPSSGDVVAQVSSPSFNLEMLHPDKKRGTISWMDLVSIIPSNAPCFAGHCRVVLERCGVRGIGRVDELRKGDRVAVNDSATEMDRVVCVVRTETCGFLQMVRLLAGHDGGEQAGLLITPWHPVCVSSDSSMFVFPAALGRIEWIRCHYVFSIVLEKHHCLLVGGIRCASLGHGHSEERKGSVLCHPFWGTDCVLADLKTMVGWKEGLVNLNTRSCTVRNDLGSVCGLRQ